MEFTLLSHNNNIVRLEAPQRITQSDLSATDPLETALGGDFSCRVLLDMHDSQFLDSTGVAWLITCHKKLKSHGGLLVLHSIHPFSMKVLSVLNLATWFSIAADENEALNLIKELDEK